MIRAGAVVAFRKEKGRIVGISDSLGTVRVAYSMGRFELWNLKSRYSWSQQKRERVVTKSAFLIAKRFGKKVMRIGAKPVLCDVLFIMRLLPAGDDWRSVKEELIQQIILLHNRERSHGRKKNDD